MGKSKRVYSPFNGDLTTFCAVTVALVDVEVGTRRATTFLAGGDPLSSCMWLFAEPFCGEARFSANKKLKFLIQTETFLHNN